MFKKKNVMVIGIQYLKNGFINVSYVLRDEINLDEYKGFIPLTFKTKLNNLFSNFNDFGKWKKGIFNSNGCIIDLR